MVVAVVNPKVTTYASRVPYITAAEYVASPTGVDVAKLIPGGQPAAESAQLVVAIARASAWIDTICNQVLAATQDVQAGSWRLSNSMVRVPLDRTPILEVNAVSWGWNPAALVALTDLSGIWIGRKVIDVPIFGSANPTLPVSDSRSLRGRVYMTVGYVNGFPNMVTTAAAAAGSSTLPVNATLGVYPGTTLTVYDGAQQETVTVLSVTSTVITLTAPLLNDHNTIGISVSSLPPDVKQACVWLTSALIKTRGTGAAVMASVHNGPGQKVPTEAGGLDEVSAAKKLLAQYTRVR